MWPHDFYLRGGFGGGRDNDRCLLHPNLRDNRMPGRIQPYANLDVLFLGIFVVGLVCVYLDCIDELYFFIV